MEQHEKKQCKCLGCGAEIDKKEEMVNYCSECFMNMEVSLKELDKDEVMSELEKILDYFKSDVTSAFRKDPAAKSIVEVLTSYPGIQAVLLYRVAHFLWTIGLPYVPRFLSYLAREKTGIDIHPGAKIGHDFFIDHGQDVVIGETSEIGNNVTLYQGVTLGGTSLEQKKRHPTLGDNIVVGAGAKVLGPINIGNNVRIGANSVVTKDIPDNSVVVGVPGRIVSGDTHIMDEINLLQHGNLPDPVLRLIESMENRIKNLEDNLIKSKDLKKIK
jgi:serine O-acetyltransferase